MGRKSKRKRRRGSSPTLPPKKQGLPGFAIHYTTDESGVVQKMAVQRGVVADNHQQRFHKTIPCPHCGSMFSTKSALQDHISINHTIPKERSGQWKDGQKYAARKAAQGKRKPKSKRTKQASATVDSSGPLEKVACPQCGKKVKKVGLPQHQQDKHGNVQDMSSSTRTPNSKDAKKKIQVESLRQSHDEPRDGSKNWGFMRRENGRFDSHPLFDDYGDESDP